MSTMLKAVVLTAVPGLCLGARFKMEEGKESKAGEAAGSVVPMAEDVLNLLIGALEEAGLETELAKKEVPGTLELFARVESKLATFPLNDEDKQFCEEAAKDFTQEDFRRVVDQYYIKDPLTCKFSTSCGGAFGIFGSPMEAFAQSSVMEFSQSCMFDDIVERFGDGGRFDQGFSSFGAASLEEMMPGLIDNTRRLINQTEYLVHKNFNGEVDPESFWLLKYAVTKMNKLASSWNPATSYMGKQYLIKAIIIYMPITLLQMVKLGQISEPDGEALLRVLFAENIQWAIDMEVNARRLLQGGASYENTNFGTEVVQKLWSTCFQHKYDRERNMWTMRDSVPVNTRIRSIAFYNVWNLRFIEWSHSLARPPKNMCEDGSAWKSLPSVIQNAVATLGASVNLATDNFSSWGSYRAMSLMLVTQAVDQHCDDGSISWVASAPTSYWSLP